ncbi:cytochrome c oxidase assembly protein [Pseudogulbenkiania ferrooxidans]|uniref:Cytochrome c oxidase assembly protein CtaG n=1 Tax=Pseudogulbenkiania ferrooxidans EGD-HP2 TaxID=1388764 RepID=A0ABN0N308_9NEIS|nr:cytochrome c oxidase assembly protein [Pseudogulbenkiania ferrooxidans]ERE00431.1 cytochrome C oxidase assembly protein [Pseudogulbenkiania ferrooxidans EGD-HP2]
MDAMAMRRRNLRLVKRLVLIVALMFAFAWAMIPLYRIVCEKTGLNDVVKADELEKEDLIAGDGEVRMTFDSTVQAGLPWQVQPMTTHLKVKLGTFVQVQYRITNASSRAVVGQALPRYLPAEAGEYVKKLECFCFTQQRFKPGETRTFPVVFVIDRKLPASITSITLAYTVFDVPGQGKG